MSEPAAVEIRAARLDDIEGILDALEPVAAENRWLASEVPLPRDRMRDGFKATIESPATALFAVADHERIDGSLGIYRIAFSGVAELGMSLLPEYRGRGIGTRLIERAIAFCRERDYYKITLYVHPWNDAALALYEKFGFEREGYLRKHIRRRSGERWDVVEMALIL